ncbi:SRPBCC family protein [Planococcus halotolerans]|uniref:SRPBCC domain-containing protein n=1 Tax=Planococcus halotolerans TaxID=2233542 RepID=A0A365KY32_9BACL|nr:SRPBCC domain-containing protein [Planococcus halotolerans]QHJ72111.1 SRPBCC domain-containing protein [Planococcus halotolerans]RAZ77873.1 SRPBCC domain-containing protein [Planococcus halotolerans]
MSTKGTRTRTEGRELIMERIFEAPKELVYEAHVSPDRINRWWGPTGWETHSYEMAVEPNGIWHYCMRSSEDGQESWGKATYQEVVPTERLVYEDAFADQYGNELSGMPKMLVQLDFSEESNQTKLTSRTRFESEEELQKIIDMQAVEGMSETYDRLAEYLNDLQKNKEEGQS